MAIAQVSVAALKGKLDQGSPVLILDVRQGLECDRRIPGSIRVEASELNPSLCCVPPETEVVVYDDVPGQDVSTRVAAALAQAGFDAEVLEGGWGAWMQAGFPVEPLPGVVQGRLDHEAQESDLVWQLEAPIGRDVQRVHADLPSEEELVRRALGLVRTMLQG
jgi:rhodanese-related sulfurtransferase